MPAAPALPRRPACRLDSPPPLLTPLSWHPPPPGSHCSLQPIFVMNSTSARTLRLDGGACQSQFSSTVYNSASSMQQSLAAS